MAKSRKTIAEKRKEAFNEICFIFVVMLIVLPIIVASAYYFKSMQPATMSNEQVISETRKCEAGGLNATTQGAGEDIYKIVCRPRYRK